MVRKRRAWHDITALGQHTRSNDVTRGMTSTPLDSTNGEQRRVCYVNTNLGQHTQLEDVKRGMTSPPLDSTHGRMTSGVACHHCLWEAHTVGLRRAWHEITALGQHIQSDNVGHGMTSLPLGNTHCRTTSRVAWHHRLWTAHSVE